jgi:hypothetical protein
MRNSCNVLVGKPEGKGPLGRPRHEWEDNIRIDLRVRGCGLDSAGLNRDQWWALVNTVMNLHVL